MPANKLNLARGLSLDPDYIAGASLALLGKRGAGKRLSLDTPLPTPDGWTTIGDVAPGDVLFDEHGQCCKVTDVWPVCWGDARRISFSDGSSLLADAEHLWLTWDKAARRNETVRKIKTKHSRALGYVAATDEWIAARPQCQQASHTRPAVRTTAEVEATLFAADGETNHSIENAQPLDLPEADLPIHPYVLGLWLGDGTRGFSSITSADPELMYEHVKALGYEFTERPSPRNGNTRSYNITGLSTSLRLLGVLREKFIPAVYLRASADQRLELLRGLLDTDGGWSRSNVEIAVSDEALADGLYELIVSLGMRVSRSQRVPRLNGRTYKTSHRLRFRPTMQVFRLSRKAEKYAAPPNRRSTHRYIRSVERVPSVRMRCITVDSPSGLFLAGTQMVPTHNTYACRVLAESLFDAHVQTVVIDPMGVFWGLRASANGEREGVPVPVFGGEHGDAPLESSAGALMADLVVEEGLSMILDLSGFGSRTQERTFAAAFFDRLYRTNKDLVHLIVDEADLFAAQKPRREDAHLLVTMENIVRRGRNKGLGITMASQRAAVLNKDVLTQVDALVALRVAAPQDRDAIREWVRGQGDEQIWSKIAPSLPGLANGECWWWIPELGVLKQVQVRKTRTFDSSPSRKRGHSSRTPKTFADVDLDAISGRIAATIERAKATDPRELSKRIRELEKALTARASAAAEPEVVEVPILDEALVSRLEASVAALAQAQADSEAASSSLLTHVQDVAEVTARRSREVADATEAVCEALASTKSEAPAGSARGRGSTPPQPKSRDAHSSSIRSEPPKRRQADDVTATSAPPAPPLNDDVQLSPARRRLLTALAALAGIGIAPADKTQLALWAGVSPKSSGFANNLGALRSAGQIDYPAPGRIALTDDGRALAGAVEQLATDDELHRKVQSLVSPARWRILEALIAAYPDALPKDALADAAGVSAGSSGYANNLGALRSLGLLDYPTPGHVAATEVLFLETTAAA